MPDIFLSALNTRSILILHTLSFAIIITFTAAVGAQTWVEDSFEDFADGTFDAAGHNLYTSARGRITTIHRFDLNTDGYLDLSINSSHDFITTPKPTLYTLPAGRGTGTASELPLFGMAHVAVADLNNDGFLDAVFAPKHNWVTHRRYLFILWGNDHGFSARRMSNLISSLPQSVQIADLDSNGWLDIIVLNGMRWSPEDGNEKLLRIYWGSENSFEQSNYTDRLIEGANDLRVADIDGDGKADLAVLHSEPPAVSIFWNDHITWVDPGTIKKLKNADVDEQTKREPSPVLPDPVRLELESENVQALRFIDYNRDGKMDMIMRGGKREVVGVDPTTKEAKYRSSGVILIPAGHSDRQWGQPVNIDAPPASRMLVNDFNHDGLADLLLADASAEKNSVNILWGDKEKIFDTADTTVLPIARASALADGDLDGDGHPDLVVGLDRGEETYQSLSRVFYGDGKGEFEQAYFGIPTSSVQDIAIVPDSQGEGNRLLFCNTMWGRINEDVPVRVFWGGRSGFDPKRFDRYSIRSGHSSNAADLNDDGFPDLILTSIVHNVTDVHPGIGINILWGGKDGLRDDRRTVVSEYGVYGTNVADLNRDGYLDIVTSCNLPNDEGEPKRLVIWHGSANGFVYTNRVILPFDQGLGHTAIADYNNDGRLDIAVACMEANRIFIFWGTAEGYSLDRLMALPMMAADDIKAADLDGNGWVDLISTSYILPKTNNYDYGTHIFWGSPDGFDPTHAQRLPGSAGYGITVADYDTDGHLDLFVANYKNTLTRQSIPSYLFWGGRAGFAEERRTELIADSGTGALSADFNGDGLIDIAVAAHSLDGNHEVNSRVYYNDAARFSHPKVTLLPTLGPHHMYHADVGHVYDRSYRQRYVSSVFRWDRPRTKALLTFVATTPGNTRLEMEVRTAATERSLTDQLWASLQKSTIDTDEQFISLHPTDLFLQYRATFISDNGDRYPVLEKVHVRMIE